VSKNCDEDQKCTKNAPKMHPLATFLIPKMNLK
jgi:hypothetical protein